MARKADAWQQRRRDDGNKACQQWKAKAAVGVTTQRNDDCRGEEPAYGAGCADRNTRRRQQRTQQHAGNARRNPADDEDCDECPPSEPPLDDAAEPQEAGGVEAEVQPVQMKK